MPIRLSALLLLVTAACAAPLELPSDAPTTSTSTSEITNTCNPVNFACQPGVPWSDRWCQIICGGEGNTQGYCLEYSAVEVAWCSAHPDKIYGLNPGRWCDPDGNPTWFTHCEPGWLP